ncbi:hypothetical protein PDIG_31370 [Penicillium digitatum PHI26]|uniref:Uncharacterized protein n=2 Tax=Penicillium digitatum TaxID=36651 RepID=K9FZY3_PEND2|nr:hypothetical protein PDIP_50950 [Penicillium digitatum Pd1]EKV12910.1 hypothetical protein PDIP_50950 [Penicillium digitatum Pd1]EKV14684.1 hypothetical protein PDIG_31370 [Penicillium digitatum PHI26]
MAKILGNWRTRQGLTRQEPMNKFQSSTPLDFPTNMHCRPIMSHNRSFQLLLVQIRARSTLALTSSL